VSAAADRAAHRAEEQQDQPDDERDDADCPENGDLGYETDQQQDDAEHDHWGSLSRQCAPAFAGRIDLPRDPRFIRALHL
jgi:hypothetical protein